MRVKTLYLLVALAGAVVPYTQLVPFVRDHGFAPALFVSQMFANRIASFFALDVLLSAVAVCVFVAVERRRGLSHWWLPIVALCAVGVSLALPLALYLRERAAPES